MGWHVCFLLLSLSSASAVPGDWPAFQGGPAHLGSAPDLAVPLEKVWEVNLKSAVYSSPVIADGKIFVASEKGEVTALSLTGETAWSVRLAGKIYASTPSVGPEALYFGAVRGNQAKTGMLYALSVRDGSVLWTFTPSGDIYSSPLLLGSLVVAGCDDGNVYALDQKTGRPVWSFRTSGKVHDNGAGTDGTRIYIGSYDGYMYALNPENGSLIWKFKTRKRVNTAAVVADGVVMFGAEDGALYAVAAETGELKWSFKTREPVLAAPAVGSDAVYVASTDGNVSALSRTGEKRWSFKAGRHVVASPVLAGSVVLTGAIDTLGILDQNLYALDAATGKVLWKFPLKGPLFATPAVSGGLLVLVSKKGFACGFRNKPG